MKTDDYPLGSTFEHEDAMFAVIEDHRDMACNDCWFGNRKECRYPHCSKENRSDRKDVVFKKLSCHESVQS